MLLVLRKRSVDLIEAPTVARSLSRRATSGSAPKSAFVASGVSFARSVTKVPGETRETVRRATWLGIATVSAHPTKH